ncbi:outer membrane protein with beta-barrel domain [Lacibacter cauensis]|uniref:Outer membrane protein with beta-barrel domain n=1 Tax=Lacibacter cauensis TaxID=510947 RepID=A0A562SHB0_9BACT|nr:porin family protein [Lacibacter cauensis]TWI80655.1 outer membrane protein with beta-barrel domain [Lacibacter cauensis]
MKMKIICLIMFAAVVGSASAQESSVFLKAGFNMANVSVTDGGDVDEARMLPSFHVGLQGDIPVIKNILSIQPGLLFTGKGSKVQSGTQGSNGYFKASTNPYYIEVPVNVVVKAPLGDGAKFFVGAGPYAAMGIAGKRKLEYQALNIVYNRTDNIEFSNDDPTTSGEEGAGYGILRRFDYGLNGTIGFEGKTAMFSVNYGLGLAKLQSGADNNADANNKHRVLSFTIGFRL